MQDFSSLLDDVRRLSEQAKSTSDLASLRQQFLGKKGALGQALRGLGQLDVAARRAAGEAVNDAKEKVQGIIEQAEARLGSSKGGRQKTTAPSEDVTLPGRRTISGAPHPLRLMERRALEVLSALGFRTVRGPLVEHEWYNFEALNIPVDHPARDMQDTFFVEKDVVLRTHTSNVQVRQMLLGEPPVRIAAPGMVFRHDDVDATHSPVFHQIEGLWIDGHTTFAELKGLLKALLVHLFGVDAEVRFRPSYFPFTEPSVEVDVSCRTCLRGRRLAESRCQTCRGSGWLEVLGAGMTHPSVLEAVGYDPERVQGFAFGMGLERAAMLSYGIEDIRLLYDNDLRFLGQFAPNFARASSGATPQNS